MVAGIGSHLVLGEQQVGGVGGITPSYVTSFEQVAQEVGQVAGGKRKKRSKKTNRKKRSTKKMRKRGKRSKRSKRCACQICDCNPRSCSKKNSKKHSKKRKTLAGMRASMK